MDHIRNISFENKYFRHGVFWLSWVIGFTFIKSFGATFNIYLGWLLYYIVTLPIFVLHTYLVVYWLGKRFNTGYKISLFVLLFFVFMYMFSAIELFITSQFLSTIFPSIFSSARDYLSPASVLISGIGNLYILLVFIAAKMIRSWYISSNYKRSIIERSLYLERADANAGIQPNMLLFALESIENFASQHREEVPDTIAMLSELLNAVMQAQQQEMQRVDEELLNVKRMIKLYSILLSKEPGRIRIDGEDLHMKMLPVFILFTPLEIIFRTREWIPGNDLLIEVVDPTLIEISWESQDHPISSLELFPIREEMDQLFPGVFSIEINNSKGFDCLQIKKLNPAMLEEKTKS